MHNSVEYPGFEPYVLADRAILDEILNHGGIPYKENRIRFDTIALLEIEKLSSRTRSFLENAIQDWG